MRTMKRSHQMCQGQQNTIKRIDVFYACFHVGVGLLFTPKNSPADVQSAW